MSKLSELLNPAPSGSEISPTTTNHAPQVHPLVLDGRNHRAPSVSYGGSPTHTRHNSITSPGLEALADAASNSAPIPSPTQHNGSFAHPIPFQPSYSQYGSRPSSSHTALPLLSTDYSHAHNFHNASNSLDHYHHQSSGERRLSNISDPSSRPPVLQQSPTYHHSTFSPETTQPLNGITDYANGTIPQQTIKSATGIEQGVNGNGKNQSDDVPTTSQIRQPSPGPLHPVPPAAFPQSQAEQIEVKAEVADNTLEMPSVERRPDGPVMEESQTFNKGTESAAPTNTTETKGDRLPIPTAENTMDAPLPKPKGPPSKKRAAPKKGTASAAKPAAKKRKLDGENGDGTLSAQRSGTPVTSRASNTPVPKNRKQGSETPARSSSVMNGAEDEDGSEEDTEAYCICRKPDDHTLMIGCDGPCEDWFHVRCVSMDSVKAKLISKWYCPNCAEKGLETLWKRMCRLEGCQEPARLDGNNRSKYCCDEHGNEFMKTLVGSETKTNDRQHSKKNRRRNNFTDNFDNQDDSPGEEPGHIKGGILKPSELKALTDGASDFHAFQRLGDGVLSPPPTVSPEGDDVKTANGIATKKSVTHTPEETAHLEEIAEKREKVRAQKKMLDDKDRFLLLVTNRAKTVLAELKERDKSMNTICGYDTRINWSDKEFNDWRASSEGKSAMEKGGILGAPTLKEQSQKREENEHGENAPQETTNVQEEEEETGKGVCKKKRCDRHKAWLKLHQQDIMFETHHARQAMRKLEAEEKDVRDRAMIRHLEKEET